MRRFEKIPFLTSQTQVSVRVQFGFLLVRCARDSIFVDHPLFGPVVCVFVEFIKNVKLSEVGHAWSLDFI